MADDLKNTANPADGGQAPAMKLDDKQTDKTFTQAELEAIIADRLKREREKYKDYSDLKKAAEEYQKLKEAQMTEQEKLQAKLAEYERQLQQKEQEATEARLKAMKVQALEKAGLPTAWADRIFGTDDKEIEDDIKELQKLLGMSPTKVGSGTNPAAAKSNVNPMNLFIRKMAGRE